MDDFFKFEDKDIDFPFYNGVPDLALKDWAVLVLGLLLELMLILGFVYYIPGFDKVPSIVLPILYVLVLFIPVAYVCKGNLALVFRKPRKSDIKIIVLCAVVYLIFQLAMVLLLHYINFNLSANVVDNVSISKLETLIMIFVQLMGEELFKFTVFIVIMALIYHFTKNRKSSMICGIVITCIAFGLVHIGAYGNLLQCLLVIGLGCIIHFYPYLKTKNVTNSYLTHVIIDLILFLPNLLK